MFSRKQLQILAFPNSDYTALICDGAIRTGKTSVMAIAFLTWAMRDFNGVNFGICSKTLQTADRNIIKPIMSMSYVKERFIIRYHTYSYLEVTAFGHTNIFYIYGGRDASSYQLIQGVTLAGVFLDEVALMPKSFVEQALARCSVKGRKFWFNCNPEGQMHWFNQEWIMDCERHNALHLHFTLDDNPALPEEIKRDYENMYTGVFHDRYIKGLWVSAEGIIYPMYQEALVDKLPDDVPPEEYVVSIDYGTMNAFAAILWSKRGGIWYGEREYYYSGRDTGIQKTDDEYAQDLNEWISDIWEYVRENSPRSYLAGTAVRKITTIIDPSAASFIALLKKSTWSRVRAGDNSVIDGIRETAVALHTGKIKMLKPAMKNWEMEASSYVWDDRAGDERPIKENDHAMDAMRYFVKTMRISAKDRQ